MWRLSTDLFGALHPQMQQWRSRHYTSQWYRWRDHPPFQTRLLSPLHTLRTPNPLGMQHIRWGGVSWRECSINMRWSINPGSMRDPYRSNHWHQVWKFWHGYLESRGNGLDFGLVGKNQKIQAQAAFPRLLETFCSVFPLSWWYDGKWGPSRTHHLELTHGCKNG